jgi:hypothetical protein
LSARCQIEWLSTQRLALVLPVPGTGRESQQDKKIMHQYQDNLPASRLAVEYTAIILEEHVNGIFLTGV